MIEILKVLSSKHWNIQNKNNHRKIQRKCILKMYKLLSSLHRKKKSFSILVPLS